MPSERVIAYIDGFNLYFGLRDSRLRRFYWLDQQSLMKNLLRVPQVLVKTKYFTARVSGPRRGDAPDSARRMEDKRQRQVTYLEALATLPDLDIFEGKYLDKTLKCRSCGAVWRSHEEKMTDVQIATEMLTDAHADRFDLALLVSADSDLVPPTRAVRSLFPAKRVLVAFPPGRSSVDLGRAASAVLTIGRGTLRRSQFPDAVTKSDGFVLRRPSGWV